MFNDNTYDRILYKCLMFLALLSILIEINITMTLHATLSMIVITFFSIVSNILQIWFLTERRTGLECTNTGVIIEKLIESNKNIKPHYQNLAKNTLLKRISKLTDVSFVMMFSIVSFIININYIRLYVNTSLIQVSTLLLMTLLILAFSLVILIRDFAQLLEVYPKFVS